MLLVLFRSRPTRSCISLTSWGGGKSGSDPHRSLRKRGWTRVETFLGLEKTEQNPKVPSYAWVSARCCCPHLDKTQLLKPEVGTLKSCLQSGGGASPVGSPQALEGWQEPNGGGGKREGLRGCCAPWPSGPFSKAPEVPIWQSSQGAWGGLHGEWVHARGAGWPSYRGDAELWGVPSKAGAD